MLAPGLLTFINIYSSQDVASYLYVHELGHEFIQLAIAATDEIRCVPSLISAFS